MSVLVYLSSQSVSADSPRAGNFAGSAQHVHIGEEPILAQLSGLCITRAGKRKEGAKHNESLILMWSRF